MANVPATSCEKEILFHTVSIDYPFDGGMDVFVLSDIKKAIINGEHEGTVSQRSSLGYGPEIEYKWRIKGL